jgi:excisionase family DNA binding protein
MDEMDTRPAPLRRIALSLTEAAAVSGLGRSTLYKLIADGELKAGGRRLILCEELERYFRDLGAGASA